MERADGQTDVVSQIRIRFIKLSQAEVSIASHPMVLGSWTVKYNFFIFRLIIPFALLIVIFHKIHLQSTLQCNQVRQPFLDEISYLSPLRSFVIFIQNRMPDDGLL